MKDNIELKFDEAKGHYELFINGVLQYGIQEVSISYDLGMENDIINISVQKVAVFITKNNEWK